MQYPVVLSGVIAPEAVRDARGILERNVEGLWRDYATDLSFEEYRRRSIYPDSRHLLFLQERCLHQGIVGALVSNRLVRAVADHLPKPMFFGIAFVRYAFPGMTSNGEAFVDDVLNSPFHYDDYHGADTRTTWITLQDSSPETGSFAFTRDPEVTEMTGGGYSPRTLHNAPADEVADYIDKVRATAQEEFCQAGDALLFDRHLLHGATYPRSLPRLSVDLRWVDSTEEGRLTRMRSKYRRRLCGIDVADRFMRAQALRRLHELGDVAYIERVSPLTRLSAQLRWRLHDYREAARLKIG